jgi:hypothetical protein
MKWVLGIACIGLLAGAPPVFPADKSGFHLLRPTPRGSMREMSADRPDITESPYTVDAGHFQVELSFLEYTRDDEGQGRTEAFALLPSNFKVGSLNNVDVQLVTEPYLWLKGNREDGEGHGATQIRVKVNLWGNDGGDTALALMPFVAFPTADDAVGGDEDRIEGGLIVPLAISLGEPVGLGLMAEFDLVWDDEDHDYDLDFIHTASLAFDLNERVGAFVEYVGVANSDGGGYQALVGVGLTYAISKDLQLDVGANLGLNDEADDVRLFSGLTLRI